MATYIRLTDYKSSGEKEQEFFNPANRYESKQENFKKISGSPIAYWASNKMIDIFDKNSNLGVITQPRVGLQTGDNDKFLRYWNEVSFDKVGFGFSHRDDVKDSALKWFPYNKGGEFQKWYGNQDYVVNWQDDGFEIQNYFDEKGKLRSRPQNKEFYFQEGITWSKVSAGSFGVRYSPIGRIFDSVGPSIFPDIESVYFFTALLCSKVSLVLLKIINPTLAFQVGDIKSFPIILSNVHKKTIDNLSKYNIDISKEEWDSRETSWDFTKNELIKHKTDTKIETAYTNYCSHWQEQHNTLHQNEEELNRLFIDIYELQDELTADVELKDITILKNETKKDTGELVFQADEIMKQFVSYGVGVMFGRYSLDSDGLLIVNIGQKVPTNNTFEIDDDNIIPIVDESDYFADDITDRFIEFVRITFGSEKLQQNIAFIEKAIGKKIRDYFMKEFYKDHISTKRYKKRPIYWLFSSPKGTFQVLIYIHRYTPDTLNHILNDYLRPFRIRLDTMRNEAMRTTEREDVSSKEKTDADKKIDKIDKTLDDINAYEKVLAHYAAQRIEIDLDDGVKVNYCKFKELLFEFDKKLCE